MAIKEGEHLLEDGETTLSSSELDDVLSSAEFQDMDAEDDSLEQYGVWVKVKPEDLGAKPEDQDVFGLSDLDVGEDSSLTAEEEELLGELEDEPMEAGEFEGLEADLEELGRSVESGDSPSEEEIPVDDLDADLQDLSFEDSDAEGTEALDDLPEFDMGADELSADQEIEVPLSEEAVVEEHFTSLPGVGASGAPGVVGAADSSKASADILEMIESDLKQIKSEIQTLKRELTSMGRAGGAAGQLEVQPVPEGPPGFFNQEEDETIALTGDELDNILNTADITEETAEPMVEEPEVELHDLGQEAVPLDLEEVEALPEEPSAEEEILELGALDLEEDHPGEEMSGEDLPEIEIDIGEAEPVESGEAAEPAEAELSAEDEDLLLENLEDAGEPVDLDLENFTNQASSAPAEAEDEEELILEDLGESPEGEEELTLDADTAAEQAGLEELELEELELEELELPAGEDAGQPVIELAEETAAESLEGFDLEEADLEAVDFEELGAAEAEEQLESIGEFEEPLGELADEDTGEELLELEGLDELSGEDSGGEVSAEELSMEELPAEDLSLEEPELAAEDAPADLELPEQIDEVEALDEVSGGQGPEAPRVAGAMSPELKKDVTSVLSYLDQLLEALPEEKIREFAQSEYFETYKRLFDELGLGA